MITLCLRLCMCALVPFSVGASVAGLETMANSQLLVRRQKTNEMRQVDRMVKVRKR